MGSAPAVLGVDPSITATGLAYGRTEALTIKTRPADGDRRLDLLCRSVQHHAERVRPVLSGVEDLPKNAMNAGLTGMAQAAVRIGLIRADVQYVLIPPATAKMYATNSGAADKQELASAAYARAGVVLGDDNQIDAWWFRAMVLDALGHPMFDLPEEQRAALAMVKGWPAGVLALGRVPAKQDKNARARNRARARRERSAV